MRQPPPVNKVDPCYSHRRQRDELCGDFDAYLSFKLPHFESAVMLTIRHGVDGQGF